MRTGDMRSEKGVQYSRDLLKHRLFLSDTGIVKCTYLNRTSFMNFPSVGRGLDIYIKTVLSITPVSKAICILSMGARVHEHFKRRPS